MTILIWHLFIEFCSSVDDKTKVILQNVQRLNTNDYLFFTDVLVRDVVSLRGMLDSGSMACTMSTQVLSKLIEAKVLTSNDVSAHTDWLWWSENKCEVQMKVFDYSFSVPALIVDGQNAELILGSNVIKHLIYDMKISSDFCGRVSDLQGKDSDTRALMQLLCNIESWKGTDSPTKIGTVKLKHAITLEPMKVWGTKSYLRAVRL